MYKLDKCFVFRNASDWKISYWKDFESKADFDQWMQDRLKEELVFIEEKSKEIPVYPQVLKLNLKYISGGYSTVIERFKSSNDYTRYCDEKLMQGYKVIGSEPYKNFND